MEKCRFKKKQLNFMKVNFKKNADFFGVLNFWCPWPESNQHDRKINRF